MILHWRLPTMLITTLVLSSATPAVADAQPRQHSAERGAELGAQHRASTVQCRTGADDFDGNGGTDLAVGALDTGGDEDSDVAPAGQVVVEMRVKSGYRTVRINPPTLPEHRIGDFGKSVAELDLSDHANPARPCADLAIGADLLDTNYDEDEDTLLSGVVLLYRYDETAKRFVELNMFMGTDVNPALTGFGDALASQQMRLSRPRARQPVLYVGASSKKAPYDRGAVVRLMLTPAGGVSTTEVIAPGSTATPQMPLTYSAAGTDSRSGFGLTLQGTPDADQVIIGDPRARDGGAVVIWNHAHPSQLLTEPRLGNQATKGGDGFGRSIWLSTEAANASGGHTYLFIGAPYRTVNKKTSAGAAFQLRYNRSTSPARAVLRSKKYWTQATKGVAGVPKDDVQFGSSFQSLSNGKSPKFLVGVPYEPPASRDSDRYGAIDVLGNGRVFTDASLYHNKNGDSVVGLSLGAWRNVDDYLAKDRWPSPGPGKWSRHVVVGDPTWNEIYSGLPAGSIHDTETIRDGFSCSYETGSCDFGRVMTSSGGG